MSVGNEETLATQPRLPSAPSPAALRGAALAAATAVPATENAAAKLRLKFLLCYRTRTFNAQPMPHVEDHTWNAKKISGQSCHKRNGYSQLHRNAR